MSTIKAINLQHPSSVTTNVVLDTGGNMSSNTVTCNAAAVNTITANVSASSLRYNNVTYISQCGAGCMMLFQNGRVYTASGTSGGTGNYATGRGLNGQVPVYGLDKFKAVAFPNETTNPIQCGTDGFSRSWALFANGNLYTWGYNPNGQMGVGNTTAYGFPTLSTTNVSNVYDHPTTSQRYPDHNKLIIRKRDGSLYNWL